MDRRRRGSPTWPWPSAKADTSLGSEFALREAMVGLHSQDYDLVLIDCPPSIGRLTQNALIPATHALIVTEPSRPALQGVGHINDTIATVRKCHNKKIKTAGIIVNLMPPKGREAQMRLEALLAALGSEVWEPPIPRRNVMSEALGGGAPIHAYGKESKPVTDVLDAHAARLLAIADKYGPAKERNL